MQSVIPHNANRKLWFLFFFLPVFDEKFTVPKWSSCSAWLCRITSVIWQDWGGKSPLFTVNRLNCVRPPCRLSYGWEESVCVLIPAEPGAVLHTFHLLLLLLLLLFLLREVQTPRRRRELPVRRPRRPGGPNQSGSGRRQVLPAEFLDHFVVWLLLRM